MCLTFCRRKQKRLGPFKECCKGFGRYSTCPVQSVGALVKANMIWQSGSTEKRSQLFCLLMYSLSIIKCISVSNSIYDMVELARIVSLPVATWIV